MSLGLDQEALFRPLLWEHVAAVVAVFVVARLVAFGVRASA